MGYDQAPRKSAKTMMSSKKALHDILTETLDVNTSFSKLLLKISVFKGNKLKTFLKV